MELRYWLAETLTGNIGPEVRVQGSPSFVSQFGGGTFTADLMVQDMRTLDGRLDTGAISRVLSWSEGGKYSLLATYGRVCVGEWLIWRTDPVSADAPVRVTGFELDGYPAFRSLNDDYVYRSADQMHIASRLLRDAFYSYQDFEINVPWPDSGIHRSISHQSHTAYYDEVLDEISSPVDGFQWRVLPRVDWPAERPLKVTRRVEFGQPELRVPSSVVLRSGDEGTRHGNLVDFPRPARDFSKYAQSVYGWGRGEGAKQQWVGLSDPTLTNQGHLIVTKNVTFPGTATSSSLEALTRAELVAAQELREPVQATVLADRLPMVPRVGDVLEIEVRASSAWPGGYRGSMQVGRVELNPTGNHLDTLKLLAL